jgi:TRAP transporter TAXI family solute receptor
MDRDDRRARTRWTIAACSGLAALVLASSPAMAQTYGLATMQPGTLAHATGSALAKVLKEKGGLNTLVQATAGETVLIPMVARGEIDLGIANLAEVQAAAEGSPPAQPDLRMIGVIFPLRAAFWVRKDAPMQTIADLRGKRVPMGMSAMRAADGLIQAQLALGGLAAKDVTPVMVPNVIRGADDFISGAADTLYFAFGAPKVREADASTGGIRVLTIPDSADNLAASRRIFPYGYLTQVVPIPLFVGVQRPMQVYTFDYVLFTNAKAKDEVVYRMVDTLLKNKAELVAVAPHLREFEPRSLYKKFNMTYHPGALKYFADNNLRAAEIR